MVTCSVTSSGLRSFRSEDRAFGRPEQPQTIFAASKRRAELANDSTGTLDDVYLPAAEHLSIDACRMSPWGSSCRCGRRSGPDRRMAGRHSCTRAALTGVRFMLKSGIARESSPRGQLRLGDTLSATMTRPTSRPHLNRLHCVPLEPRAGECGRPETLNRVIPSRIRRFPPESAASVERNNIQQRLPPTHWRRSSSQTQHCGGQCLSIGSLAAVAVDHAAVESPVGAVYHKTRPV
jgi:hypothetical protein